MTARVCVFAKPAVPGAAKTRLAPAVGERAAARLARAFLSDTWHLVCSRSWAIPVLATTHLDAFTDTVGPSAERLLQGNGELGARIERVLQLALDRGTPALALGADSPGLPASRLDLAHAALGTTDAVLGPSVDGGFYLLGVRHCPAGLLDDIPWSSRQTFDAVRERCSVHGLSLTILPPWFDVDTPEDLALLEAVLARGAVRASATAEELRTIRAGSAGPGATPCA
jgi:rSAM/selenodomain-associated transferase 1